MIEGEGSVNSAGSRSQRPIAVQLTDETGRPLEGIAVSFRLPEEGPGGAFESGMKTEVVITSADGRAAIHGIRWNRAPGPFQIRVTAAKGESRAGSIVSQYISDQPAAKGFGGPVTSSSIVRAGGGKKKWIAIAALAAGGALAAGMTAGGGAGISAGSGGATPQQPGQQPPSTGAAAPIQIGLPTITIARP